MWKGHLKASKGLKADFTPRCTTNRSGRTNGLPAHSRVPTNVRHSHFITLCRALGGLPIFLFHPPPHRALQHITVHNSKQSPLGNVNTLKRKVVVSAPRGRKRVITFAESWIMDWVAVISSMICIECRTKTESARKVVLGGREGGVGAGAPPPFLADPNNIVEVLSSSPALLPFAFFHIIPFVKSA